MGRFVEHLYFIDVILVERLESVFSLLQGRYSRLQVFSCICFQRYSLFGFDLRKKFYFIFNFLIHKYFL